MTGTKTQIPSLQHRIGKKQDSLGPTPEFFVRQVPGLWGFRLLFAFVSANE
jgi:hypothetical protein